MSILVKVFVLGGRGCEFWAVGVVKVFGFVVGALSPTLPHGGGGS